MEFPYMVGIMFAALASLMVGSMYIDQRTEQKKLNSENNQLYKCGHCNRFFRKYFSDFRGSVDSVFREKRLLTIVAKTEADPNFTSSDKEFCPHCMADYADRSNATFVWLKHHPDAPELTRRNRHALTQSKENISILMYEEEVNIRDISNDIDLECTNLLLEMTDVKKVKL